MSALNNTYIARIGEMEQALNEAAEAVRRLDESLDRYAAAREALEKLSAYYGSAEWHAHRAADEAGALPPDLRRGVLSEDGIWNVLADNAELLRRMQALSAPPADTDQP